MTRNTNFFRYFFTRRPVSFLAVRALAELLEFGRAVGHAFGHASAASGDGEFLSPATGLHRGVSMTRDASGCPGTI
jgi:hypothetical protein